MDASSSKNEDMTPLERWQRMARAENERAQRNWMGLVNNQPVDIRKLKPEPQARPVKKAEEIKWDRTSMMRIQRLHADGLSPEKIAAQLEIAEAQVWTELRELYRHGHNKVADAYRRLRLARLSVLKAQGLKLPEIAAIFGVTPTLLRMDMRKMQGDQAQGKARRGYDRYRESKSPGEDQP